MNPLAYKLFLIFDHLETMLFTMTEKSSLLLTVLLVGIRTSRSKLIADDMEITTNQTDNLQL